MLSVMIATHMVIRPGDHAVIITPHWPNVEMAMKWAGAEVSHFRQHSEKNKWALNLGGLMSSCKPEIKLCI